MKVLRQVSPVDQGDAKGAVYPGEVRFGKPGCGGVGSGDPEVFVDERVRAKGGEDKDLGSGAVQALAEAMSGGQDSQPAEITFSAENEGADPIAPIITDCPTRFEESGDVGVAFGDPVETAVVRIIGFQTALVPDSGLN